MTLNQLRRLNKHISIKGITNKSFMKYGKIITGYDFTNLISYVEKRTPVPGEGNLCVYSVDSMEGLDAAKKLSYNLFGEMDIQIGYCNGMNSKLNYLEYHKSSELLVAVTDLTIFLGRVQDIKENQYECNRAEIFFIPEGVTVELYSTTLHSMPCRMEDNGFRSIMVLPRRTNSALRQLEKQDALLHSRNSWVIAHIEVSELVNNETQIGLIGENVEVYLRKEQ
jgi:hypothetical protein